MKAQQLWHLARGTLAYSVAPLAGLATAPILAHTLGPADRGRLAAVLQPLTVAEAIALLGVPAAVAVFVARGEDSAGRIGVRLVLPSCLATVAALLVYATVVSTQQGIPVAFLMLIWLSLLLTVSLGVRRGHVQGLGRYALLDLERTTGPLLRFSFFVLLAIVGWWDFMAYATAHIAAILIAGMILLVGYRRWRAAPSSLAVKRRMRAFSLKSAVGSIGVALNARLDQAILPLLLAPAGLGIYAVAVTVAEIPSVLTSVASRNILPLISSEQHAADAVRIAWLAQGACLATCLCLGLLAPWAVPLLFGGAFASAIPVIWILLCSTALSGAGLLLSTLLTGGGRPIAGSVMHAAGVVATCVGLGALAGQMSPASAALISLISQFCVVATGALQGVLGRRTARTA